MMRRERKNREKVKEGERVIRQREGES